MRPELASLISTRGQYNHLASIYLPIAGAVFALIVGTALFAVVRYRRAGSVSRRATNNLLEGSYTVLLACVAGVLLYLTLTAEHRVDTVANRERPSVTVDVTAAKWEWQFRYPNYGIVRRSGTIGDQPLVVPADRAIRFNLTSQDVIHAFWVPELRFKRDLFQGTVQHVTLTFTRPGTFKGQCAEFCGLRHSEMLFRVEVLSPGRFTQWADANRGRSST
jgi:cytochrome c oxidase subunit II